MARYRPELKSRDPRVDQALAAAGMMRLGDAREMLDVPLDLFRTMQKRGWLTEHSIRHPVKGDLFVPCVRQVDVERLAAQRRQLSG